MQEKEKARPIVCSFKLGWAAGDCFFFGGLRCHSRFPPAIPPLSSWKRFTSAHRFPGNSASRSHLSNSAPSGFSPTQEVPAC